MEPDEHFRTRRFHLAQRHLIDLAGNLVRRKQSRARSILDEPIGGRGGYLARCSAGERPMAIDERRSRAAVWRRGDKLDGGRRNLHTRPTRRRCRGNKLGPPSSCWPQVRLVFQRSRNMVAFCGRRESMRERGGRAGA